jgi:hypothetical protein
VLNGSHYVFLSRRIGHDNKGGFSAWYVSYVLIECLPTNESVRFVANRWIDKKHGLEVELLPSGALYFQLI